MTNCSGHSILELTITSATCTNKYCTLRNKLGVVLCEHSIWRVFYLNLCELGHTRRRTVIYK